LNEHGAMDFFAQQDRARKQTTLMMVLFLAAVACIVLAINVVGGIIYLFAADDVALFPLEGALGRVPGAAYWVTSIVVLAIIGLGTALRLQALSGGGAAVAALVGARAVKRDSRDLVEKRLLNIVEEMAIASGINVPLVFVMDDQSGVNAFAAGYSPNEAAITVTRGALDLLNRDELQGVIGHEFSHVLNGDMRLNVRLMGVIAGITMISSLGRFAMDLGSGGGNSDSYGSSGRTKGDIRVFLVGLSLWLIGSIGALFGSLIKAAISRQREYLADASAVQFTRNPDGIGSALYRISTTGSRVHERHAEEFSHMYFGEPVAQLLFASHPPVEERIARIMGPGAHHILRDRHKRALARADAERPSPVVEAFNSPLYSRGAAAAEALGFAAGPALAGGQGTVGVSPAAVVASIGTLSDAKMKEAQRLVGGLPEAVRQALATDQGARAALFALLLGEGAVRDKQLAAIAEESGRSLADQAAQIADALGPLGVRVRLPVFELAAPGLRSLNDAQRDSTLALVNTLINADGRITLAEFVLLTLCRRHLDKPPRGAPPVKHRSLADVSREAGIVLSLLARSSQAGEECFPRVMAGLQLKAGKPPPFTLALVEAALYELKLLAPLKKPAFIKACVEIVMADGRITVTEGELIRAICAALDTPLPPLVEDGSGWQEAA
jgi:Zn-dependent protease with chaperone function